LIAVAFRVGELACAHRVVTDRQMIAGFSILITSPTCQHQQAERDQHRKDASFSGLT
jgi:hypothetical protein